MRGAPASSDPVDPPRSRTPSPPRPPPPRIILPRVAPYTDGGNPFASQAGNKFEQPAAPAERASFGGGGMPTSGASPQGAMLEFSANQWRHATGTPYWWILFAVIDVACSCALIADGFLCVRIHSHEGACTAQRVRAFVAKIGGCSRATVAA